MNGKDLSRQLSGLPEELIAEAMAPVKQIQRKNAAIRVLRVAAIAAAVAILFTVLSFWPAEEDGVVAAPGMLRVYACELDAAEGSSLEQFELTAEIDSYNFVWNPGVSGLITGMGIPLTFHMDPNYYGEADISFHLSVDHGSFRVKKNSPDSPEFDDQERYMIANDETAVWRWREWHYAAEVLEPWEPFYAYVLIYANEHLVGYGIIDFVYYPPVKEGMNPAFAATNFTTDCFPMTEGEYPSVSEEYVWEQIENHKRGKEAKSLKL